MKHSLQLRLSQHLTLTPQLQQSIRLLQLSTLELTQELERVLQENPLLERDDGMREQAAPAGHRPGGGRRARRRTRQRRMRRRRRGASDEGETADFQRLDDAPPSGYRDENDESESQQVAADTLDAARAPAGAALAHQAVRARPQAREPADRLARRRRLSHAEPRGARRDPAARARDRARGAADRVEAPAAPRAGRHRRAKPERMPRAAARRAARTTRRTAPRRSTR